MIRTIPANFAETSGGLVSGCRACSKEWNDVMDVQEPAHVGRFGVACRLWHRW